MRDRLGARQHRTHPAQRVSLAHHALDRPEPNGPLVVVDAQSHQPLFGRCNVAHAGELDHNCVRIDAHDVARK